MAEKKITKSQRFEDIALMLHGESVKYGTTLSIADEFLAHERELLAKKNTADRKPTADQLKNKSLQDKIIAFLSEQTEGVTCTQIGKGLPELNGETVNKVVGLMRGITANEDYPDRPVMKSTVKGKSLFVLAPSFAYEVEGE